MMVPVCPKDQVPYDNRDPKRDPNIDNHSHGKPEPQEPEPSPGTSVKALKA